MSETLTTTPDTHTAAPSLHIDGAPDALQIDKIEALRTAEAAHEEAAVAGIFWMDLDARVEAREKAQADFDDIIKQHLKDNGIEEDDPKYAEYEALLRDSSIDKIDDDEWKPEVLPAGTAGPVRQSGRSLVYDQVRSTYGTATPAPAVPAPTAPTVPLDVPKTTAEIKGVVDALPEIIAARTKVNILREELAELSAKRQRRLFSRSNTLYEFDDKVDQYEEAVNELAKAELKAEKDAGKERDETEERFAAALKLVDNYRQLQELSVDKLKKTKVSGFIRFMTSGSTGMRMLKGAGLGIGFSLLAGTVVAATGGAAGVGLLTGGGIVASRFARSYARFDNEDNRGLKIADASLDTEVVDKSGATGKDSDETIELVNKYLLDQLERDMVNEQDKRRKATTKAMAMVAVGSLAGEALHYGHDLYASHHAHGVDSSSGKTGNGSGPNTDPGAGGKPEVPAPASHDYLDDAGAHIMSNGEGLYQTFHEMGIPQKDWPALLEQAGPKLHDMQVHGHSLAYRMPNGEWGLRMTADGTFPQQGLDVISNTHDHITGVVTDNASNHVTDHMSDRATEVAPHNHATLDTDTSDASAADADMTTEVPVAHNMIDSVLDKPVVNPSDISGNPTLSQLTHVIPNSHASYLSDKLNLRPTEWQPVEDYIAHQTSQHRPLYDNVFQVTDNGVVEFKTNTLPPATMADIITHIPTSVRSRL
jgi:hypothetical protein